jgi:hypothetical protein
MIACRVAEQTSSLTVIGLSRIGDRGGAALWAFAVSLKWAYFKISTTIVRAIQTWPNRRAIWSHPSVNPSCFGMRKLRIVGRDMADAPMTVVETARFLKDVKSVMLDSEREGLVTFLGYPARE